MQFPFRPLMNKLSPFVPNYVKHAGYELIDFGQRAFSSVRVEEQPIFVLGNHKAGTTAVAALLGELSGLPVSLELKRQIHRPQFDQVYSGQLPMEVFVNQNRVAFSRRIIKENQLLFVVDALHRRFPEGQFVGIIRDPRDNIRSILNRLDLPGDGDQSFRAISVGRGWRHVIDNTWLDIDCENYIEQLAHRWNRAAEIYLANRQRIQLVQYEKFNENKREVLVELAERLGIRHENDITPWLNVQYQPRGNRSITWPEFFGSHNLKLIETICSDGMNQFDYK